MKKLITLILVLAVISTVVFAAGGGQQSGAGYPSRPVTIIVPFGPGGGTDVLVRTIMRYLDLGGQSVVAVNIEGAAGFVGSMDAANRPADGYTILCQAIPDMLAYTLSGVTNRPLFDELVPICVIASDYDMVSTNAQSGFRNVQDLVAFARANPGQIRWGTTGTRTPNAVNSMWMAEDLGIADLITFVPYDGGAQARPALLGNHIQMLTGATGDIFPHVQAGEVTPLMVINDQRIGILPDTPTTLESGANAVQFVARSFWAPRGTPREVISILEAALKRVSENPAFVADLRNLGIDVRFIDSAAMHTLIRNWHSQLEPRFARLQ